MKEQQGDYTIHHKPDEPQATVSLKGIFADLAPDLKLTLAFTAAAVAFIYVPVLKETPVEAALGIIMVLFVPGYAVMAAMFARKSSMDLIERTALSFGVSIAASSLFALFLNFTPVGIRLDPIILFLVALTLISVPVANVRRHALPPDDRYRADFTGLARGLAEEFLPASRGRNNKPITIAMLACVLLSLCLLAAIVVLPHKGEKYTEFYILGPDGKMGNYPVSFADDTAKPVVVGIGNHEQANVRYTLVVQLDDQGNTTQIYNASVAVADGQTWENPIQLNPGPVANDTKIEFLLFDNDNPTVPYQETYLWAGGDNSTQG